jgi:lipoprotein LprG
MTPIARAAALLLVAIVLACSGPGSAAPSATTVLRQSGQAMAGIHSVSADVKFGPGIQVQGLTLTSATSKIQLPSDSDSVFKIKQGDFLVDLRVVTVGGHLYLRLPFSQFTEVGADRAAEIPDVSKLMNPKSGLPALLPAGTDPRYLGTEQVGGTDSDKVSATYTAAQIEQLLGGSVKPAGDIKATIWSGRSDHLVRRAVLNGPLVTAGTNVQVEVDLHDFNQPVNITKPI